MTKENKYVPYTQSKSLEERIAYVKANPDKYKPHNEWLEQPVKQKDIFNMKKEIEILKKYIDSIKQ